MCKTVLLTGDPIADRHQGGRFCSTEAGGDSTKPNPM
jgi:hypothetical protein